MRTYDLSPLFRSTIGFDRVGSLLDTAARVSADANSYPPYNIEKHSEDAYRLTMAVAGFADEDLDITVKENSLVVSGRRGEAEEGEQPVYLHRGIASRGFERRFQLADHIQVTEASLENGLLHIDLVREVPEALKPRTIGIKGGAKRLEGTQAA